MHIFGHSYVSIDVGNKQSQSKSICCKHYIWMVFLWYELFLYDPSNLVWWYIWLRTLHEGKQTVLYLDEISCVARDEKFGNNCDHRFRKHKVSNFYELDSVSIKLWRCVVPETFNVWVKIWCFVKFCKFINRIFTSVNSKLVVTFPWSGEKFIKFVTPQIRYKYSLCYFW